MSGSAAAAAEEARKELAACEKEIANIKAALHSLGQQALAREGAEDAASNSLSVAWLKVRNCVYVDDIHVYIAFLKSFSITHFYNYQSNLYRLKGYQKQ